MIAGSNDDIMSSAYQSELEDAVNQKQILTG